ncbi:hypothetical protein MTR72_33705 [Bradyrhizobium sp. ISRA442]|uniref:hypothetical protein n=1 Tax=Bradyrhizobium sp. ISRA442 TaxID=2866197 RepID=UPI00311B0AAC
MRVSKSLPIECARHHWATVDDPDGGDLFGQRKGCTGQSGVTIDARRPFLRDNPLKAARKNGLLRHKSSANDARNVQMLTAETRKHLAPLAPRQAAQDELAFDECGIDRSSELIAKAATVRHRLERARSGIKKTKRTTVRNGAR